MKTYLYNRVSSGRQSKNDSDGLKRQSESLEVKDFISKHNLDVVERMVHIGSSFKGKNFDNDTALGKFIEKIKTGEIETPVCLCFENWDRFGRDVEWKNNKRFYDLIHAGVSIGVVTMNIVIDQNYLEKNPNTIQLVANDIERSRKESQRKSGFSKRNILQKIEKIKNGQKVSMGIAKPTWIAGLKDGKFIFDETKVELVKRIFTRYLAGDAASRIAADLNQDEVPTLSGVSGYVWASNTVLQILRNKNVIGWMGINEHEFDNYFPPIISQKNFQLVQQKLLLNHKNRGGSKSGYVNNLFKGLLVCAECGKTIEVKIAWYRNVKGEDKRYYTYTCSGVFRGTNCRNKGRVLVSKFEINYFNFVFMAKVDQLPEPTNENNLKLIGLENDLAKIEMKIERLAKLFQSDDLNDIPELTASLREMKKQRETIRKNIITEKAKTITKDNLPKVVKSLLEMKTKEVLGETITDLEDRKKARGLMADLYEKITLKFGKEQTHAVFYSIDGTKAEMKLRNPKNNSVTEPNYKIEIN